MITDKVRKIVVVSTTRCSKSRGCRQSSVVVRLLSEAVARSRQNSSTDLPPVERTGSSTDAHRGLKRFPLRPAVRVSCKTAVSRRQAGTSRHMQRHGFSARLTVDIRSTCQDNDSASVDRFVNISTQPGHPSVGAMSTSVDRFVSRLSTRLSSCRRVTAVVSKSCDWIALISF